MVQGVKTKSRKSPTVPLDYVINIIDIKPWPPSQSLRSLRSVLLQWEHGGKSSGSTKAVAPLLVSDSGVGDGKIEFNESFKLRVTLLRDMSIKAGDNDTFLKNCIEFNMFEPRRDKTVKGQLLATAVVDFAEYGIVKDGLEVSVPVNCKRVFSNSIQPMLFLKIEAVDKSNRVRSDSMNEETESASVTDDDVSSQSSMAAVSLTSRSNRINPQEEFLVQDKTVAVPVAEAKDDIRYQINDAGDQQSYMPVSNTDESLNEQESRILKATESNILTGDRFRKVKSANSPLQSGYNNGSLRSSKVQQLEQKVQSLEGELREAAAIEVGLYSIVAEHGSSVNKVHAPARRLSRLYLHSCKEKSQSRRASSARSIVSGLILVAKACGNDVPRLTFWMSNCVVLRAIIYNNFEQEHLALSSGRLSKKNFLNRNNDINSSFKWKEGSSVKESRSGIPNEWQNPCTLTTALEKVESWIFSRIIESVWWQTLTPYMQSAAAKAIVRVVDSGSSKASKKTLGQRDQEQANFSTELWTTAFMDACERICPVRAGGHDCGCLPVLSRLVMEQCMTRLDVAMFNAILRESADDVPTDPVSDPISDARVLPISSGKASFGAGAQLKNALGNWSRWLTDLFGIDDDPLEDENDDRKIDVSFKSFHLLNALSDLMMLPKDMLLDSTVRKEVCPAFGAPVIRRMLDTFVPDEFCPDRIPEAVFKALDSEESFEGGDCVTSLPCAAASVVYHPPSASSIRFIFGDSASRNQLTRSGSILKKSNTSDDELDELSSPLTSIIGTPRGSPAPTKPNWRSKDTGSHSSIRYKLLKEVWMDNE